MCQYQKICLGRVTVWGLGSEHRTFISRISIHMEDAYRKLSHPFYFVEPQEAPL